MKRPVKFVILGVIALIVVILVVSSVATIPAGHTGVIVTMGAVNEANVLQEGMHFKAPFFQQVVRMNNQTVKTETDATAASKDLQTVASTIAVNYHVDAQSSAKLYKSVGLNYDTVIIAPAIQESIKSVTAKYTAEELITKRQEVSSEVKDMLYDKLITYGIITDVFNIISFDFSAEFNAAVEAKQTAQQNALKAEQDLQRIEVEARQQVTQAQAEADSIRLVQEALQLSPEYIEYVKWQKWNGQMPNVMAGDSGGLILDVSGEQSTEASGSPSSAQTPATPVTPEVPTAVPSESPTETPAESPAETE